MAVLQKLFDAVAGVEVNIENSIMSDSSEARAVAKMGLMLPVKGVCEALIFTAKKAGRPLDTTRYEF